MSAARSVPAPDSCRPRLLASTWVATVAVSTAVVGYLSVFVPWVAKPPGATIASIAAIWLLVGANLIGPKFVARLAGWTLAIGLIPILIVAIGGWFVFDSHIFSRVVERHGKEPVAVVPHTTCSYSGPFSESNRQA